MVPVSPCYRKCGYWTTTRFCRIDCVKEEGYNGGWLRKGSLVGTARKLSTQISVTE